jgi:post-segregation antitoxin (ccd killing protein)
MPHTGEEVHIALESTDMAQGDYMPMHRAIIAALRKESRKCQTRRWQSGGTGPSSHLQADLV